MTRTANLLRLTIPLLASALCGCRDDTSLPPGVSALDVAELSGVVPAIPRAPGTKRPNLLVVSLDTLRADHVSAYGYSRRTTPAIDALAAEGVLFERAFAQAPRTAQSHMSLFTGLYPPEHRVENFADADRTRLPDSIPTLASILRDHGYVTHGYVGGGNIDGTLGFDIGFDVYENRRVRQFEIASEFLEKWSREPAGMGYFLFVHTYRPHDPYVDAKREYVEEFTDPAYDGDIIESREELIRAAGDDWQTSADHYWSLVDKSDPADVQHLIDMYDACIRSTDDSLADLLDTLDRTGLAAETIVVLLSDHGEEFGEHGQFTHYGVNRETLHVPLVFRFPGRRDAGPRRVAHDVRMVDVLPTLLAALDLPAPGHLQGRSLEPMMTGEESEGRPVYGQYDHRGYATFRSGPWTLVQRERRVDAKRFLGIEFPFRRMETRRWLYIRDDWDEVDDLAAAEPHVVSALAREIERKRELMRANGSRMGEMSQATPDADTLRQLEALGYVGD